MSHTASIWGLCRLFILCCSCLPLQTVNPRWYIYCCIPIKLYLCTLKFEFCVISKCQNILIFGVFFFPQPLKTEETIWGLLRSSTYLIGHTRRRKKRTISYWLLLTMAFYNSNSKCIETSLICKSFGFLLLPLVGRWVNFTFYVNIEGNIET